jgi:N-carbamoyl-L-amino-acid hydrolase
MTVPNLNIDPEKLWGDLMETARIGATEKGGINRLTLTDLDREVRDWFKARAMSLGATVTVDDMGAMFARKPGQRSDIPPIAIGSHLDTQPTGGKFDGCLGVHAALEVLRVLKESGYETFAPIEAVNWTNEEGSRFTPAMVASGVFSGGFDHDWAQSRPDRSGVTFGQALDAIGYRGNVRCGKDHPLSAFFELHIEQGPNLEIEGKDIGVVTGIQGIRWFEATVTGAERHAGTTSMPARRDALLAAARIIDKIDGIAHAHKPLAVTTVGLIEAKPNSPNVVSGDVFFTIDMRHPDAATLAAMSAELDRILEDVRASSKCEIALKKILDQPPVHFDQGCIAAVRAAAKEGGFSTRDIVSGAGHDAGYVSRVAPATMIFVPCKDGISHNEAEHSSKEQCAAGAQVLLRAVLAYDRQLAERHGAK